MTSNIIIIAIIVNVIISQVIATSVKNREITSAQVFWLSFLFSPLVGMFAAMMSPVLKPDENGVTQQRDEDKIVTFIDTHFKWILFGFLVIFILSGMWR